VVVNPPRRGLDAATIDAIARSGPFRVAYLSCLPRTLVRDLDRFARAGYRPITVELFDMFPQTEQEETLAILERDTDANTDHRSVQEHQHRWAAPAESARCATAL
jgi:23S rRNA (uracil1939-C5)-methyltransferase